jgi:hypothetical protein
MLRFRYVRRLDPEPLEFVAILYALEGVYREGLWAASYVADPLDEYPRDFWRELPSLTKSLPPPLPASLRLRVKRLTKESPLTLLLSIPHEFYVAGGITALFGVLGRIERLWNAPGRVRLERAELRRDHYRTLTEADEAEDAYYRQVAQRTGFELEDGSLEIPDDWQWPDSEQ